MTTTCLERTLTFNAYVEFMNRAIDESERHAEGTRGHHLAFAELHDLVDTLSFAERRELRVEAEAHDFPVLRSLGFDYATQTWIQ